MNEISKVRFEALASYARHPLVSILATELRWLETAQESVLATIILDTDGEYSGIIFARDMRERYRWISMTEFFKSPDEALIATEQEADAALSDLDQKRQQGDERGPAMDFFSPVRPPTKLNPGFVRVATEEGYSPAREIIEPMMRWYEDADGNFVEQFQTTGFDARIWELYIFAVLGEAGYVFDEDQSVPDFVAHGLLGQLSVEATTINPTLDAKGSIVAPPPTDTAEQQHLYEREYLPIRYAGALLTKLSKRYWELPHVSGAPLLFAIQDFHAPMSMTWSRSGLSAYLYGYRHEPKREKDSSLTITPQKVASHHWGGKEVASGFFMNAGAENVSAVLFNASGTISKFNRMGLIAGFGSKRVKLLRQGVVVDHAPNAYRPKPFVLAVEHEGYKESWMEGMDVYHNPFARYPLDPDMLRGAAHHRLLSDGQVESLTPKWHPLSSVTSITLE